MANKRKRRQNKKREAQFTVYKNTNKEQKNKEAKVLRHLAKHPNDEQSKDKV